MKLIGSHASLYAYKAHVVLAEKKIDYQFVLKDVWSTAMRIHQFNPFGKAPCLVMDDDGTLLGSRVIAGYADTLSPVARLIPPSSREHVEACCQEALADGLLDIALMLYIEHMRRTPEQRSETWLVRRSHKIDQTLQIMSQGLVDKTRCNDNHLALVDIVVDCVLAYLDFRQPQVDWRECHTNLATFYARMEKRSSLMKTQPQ